MLSHVTSHRLFNPGPSPVVYDAEGHQLGVGAFVDAEAKDEVTARLIERGALLDKGTTAKAEKAEKGS
jgi:hypothetical protein